MNRETKRMLKRQGQLGPDGAPAAPPRRPPTPTRPQAGGGASRRSSATGFIHDVRSELRRVAWPTRAEVLNYSIIVLVTLIILITLIFILDYVFAKSILFLFET